MLWIESLEAYDKHNAIFMHSTSEYAIPCQRECFKKLWTNNFGSSLPALRWTDMLFHFEYHTNCGDFKNIVEKQRTSNPDGLVKEQRTSNSDGLDILMWYVRA